MRLGVHISAAGKIYEAFKRADAVGCNTMQIFARNPQRWRHDFLNRQDIEEFKKSQEKYKIKPVFIHVPYLINLASPYPKLYQTSIEAYIEDILEAEALGVDYIVTHMGSHKNTTEEAGIKRITEALNVIIDKTKNAKVGILLENTSGAGSWLGYKFAHQKEIIRGIKNKKRVALCFDTAHAYLAGYDISTKKGLEDTMEEIDSLVGRELLKLVHFNDAKGELGSHQDRHDHIGKGSIGLEGMKRVINHPYLRDCAFILETPKDDERSDVKNLEIVKKMVKK